MKRYTACFLISTVLIGVALAWAAEPWNEKPYTEWTKEEVQHVLESSPWAREANIPSREKEVTTVPRGGTQPAPGDPIYERGRGDPTYRPERGDPRYGTEGERRIFTRVRDIFVVRWESSRTVREALLRREQMDGSAREDAAGVHSPDPNHYLIFVSGAGCSLREPGYLQPQRSKQKIYTVGRQDVRAEGLLVGRIFYFPRETDGKPTIRSEETKVKFYCPALVADHISAEFDLRKMVRDGKPDL